MLYSSTTVGERGWKVGQQQHGWDVCTIDVSVGDLDMYTVQLHQALSESSFHGDSFLITIEK
jgi:hypothetical protein